LKLWVAKYVQLERPLFVDPVTIVLISDIFMYQIVIPKIQYPVTMMKSH